MCVGSEPEYASSTAHLVKQALCTIDLSRCRSIDTSGIIILLTLREVLIRFGKTCTVEGMTGDVEQVMKRTKVRGLFMKQ